MKNDREALIEQRLKDEANARALIDNLMQEELLDDDGYPTQAALDIVQTWHWMDARGWFEFIKSIWNLSSWGWHESTVENDYNPDKVMRQYDISTGGWSGNEAIIEAMQANGWMWHLNWVQSRRGGHYIFELKEFDNEE
jgi:hypothetical protein